MIQRASVSRRASLKKTTLWQAVQEDERADERAPRQKDERESGWRPIMGSGELPRLASCELPVQPALVASPVRRPTPRPVDIVPLDVHQLAQLQEKAMRKMPMTAFDDVRPPPFVRSAGLHGDFAHRATTAPADALRRAVSPIGLPRRAASPELWPLATQHTRGGGRLHREPLKWASAGRSEIASIDQLASNSPPTVLTAWPCQRSPSPPEPRPLAPPPPRRDHKRLGRRPNSPRAVPAMGDRPWSRPSTGVTLARAQYVAQTVKTASPWARGGSHSDAPRRYGPL